MSAAYFYGICLNCERLEPACCCLTFEEPPTVTRKEAAEVAAKHAQALELQRHIETIDAELLHATPSDAARKALQEARRLAASLAGAVS